MRSILKWLPWLGVALACQVWAAHGADKGNTAEIKVLEFAPVVTAIPNAVVGEVMRRDQILGTALGGGFGYHPIDSGRDILRLFSDGRINATIGSDVTLIELTAHAPVIAIGLYKDNFGAVVGPKGQTLASLKGKRIASVGAGAGHFTLLRALNQAGLKESDVTLVTLGVREMPKALVEGRIDAFASFEPAPSAVIGEHANRFGILYRHRSPGYLMVSRQLLNENPAATRQLAAALARAVNWLRKDRENLARASRWAAEAMRAYKGPELSEREIARMTKSDLLEIREAPAMSTRDVEEGSLVAGNFGFMSRQGLVPAHIEWTQVRQSFDFAVMRDVLGNPRQYRLSEFRYAP